MCILYNVQCTVHTPKSPRSNPITLIGYYSIALLIQISQINKLYKYHNVLNSERYGADECILVEVAGSVFSSLRYICTALKFEQLFSPQFCLDLLNCSLVLFRLCGHHSIGFVCYSLSCFL